MLGAVILLVGFLLDGEPLLVAGAALALLSAGCVVWVALAARGLEVTRELAARRVVEDEPLGVEIHVRGRVPWPGGQLHESLLPDPAPLAAIERSANVRIAVRFQRRGMRELPPPVVVLSDPLGLAVRHVAAAEPVQVLVLPQTFPVVAASLAPGDGRSVGLEALAAGAAATEFDGLMPYREGAPAARIHWPALARGAGLLERRLKPEGDARPLVLLDPRAPASDEALDAAVRAAASLGLELARSGGCALLLPGERRPRAVEQDLAGWPAAARPPRPGRTRAAARARCARVAPRPRALCRRAPAAPAARPGRARRRRPLRARHPGRVACSRGAVHRRRLHGRAHARPRACGGGGVSVATKPRWQERPAPVPPAPRRRAAAPLLEPLAARTLAGAALGIFAGLAWGTLLEPSRGWSVVMAVAVGVAGGVAFELARALPRGPRITVSVAALVVTVALAILAAGIPLRFVVPGGWGDLVDGVSTAFSSLPGVRVPFRGIDEWIRWTILLGGTLLASLGCFAAVAAAALAWPPSRSSCSTRSRPSSASRTASSASAPCSRRCCSRSSCSTGCHGGPRSAPRGWRWSACSRGWSSRSRSTATTRRSTTRRSPSRSRSSACRASTGATPTAR